jgi:AraC-like DNA-binding protein
VSGLFCDGPRTERCSASPRFREAVGLKVRVGALQAVVGIPAKHLVNQRVPLEAIWGRDAFELADRIAGATSAAQRLQILEKELMRQAQRRAELHPIASHIAALIDQTGGQVRIHDLADACGMSERALRYKFDDCAGLTPKQYTRLVRLRACIARLDASHIDWAGLAVDCGFHDQSHMIHEFQELVGASPTEFVRQRAANNGIVARTVESDVVSDRKRRLYQMSGFVSKWVEG